MINKIEQIDFKNKKVLIRVDFNVPIQNGVITDDTRIVEALPTINYIKNKGGKLILFSHLGRIKTADDLKKNSLEIVSKKLSSLLNENVLFVNKTRGVELEEKINLLNPGEILMVENTRFEDLDGKKESKNDPELGKYWASLGDIFINDAFGTAHRAHASNVGIASNMKIKAPGFLLQKEIEFIGGAIDNPKRPFYAILGGAKVSDKIEVIKNLLKVADKVFIGGGMAYTFYKALGYEVGLSLLEVDKVELAKELLDLGRDKIVLGLDVVTTKEFDKDAKASVYNIDQIPSDEMGMDIGPKTIELFNSYLVNAKTVVLNGPLGVFEFDNFAVGTKSIAKTLASIKDRATTIIGGGDSAAAITKFGLKNDFSHISTGGGASLEYLEGKVLPGIECVTNDWFR